MISGLLLGVVVVCFAYVFILVASNMHRYRTAADFTPEAVGYLTKRIFPIFVLMILLVILASFARRYGW